ncbi:MAG: FtsX-like permease family protein [Roseimicrobium sp.]
MSLIIQSLRHYAKAHLGLLFGAFLASAVLSGSMVVGDSVRDSLRKVAGQRLGKIQSGLVGGDRWFTEKLARDCGTAPVIQLRGSASETSGKSRVNAVQVFGVEASFWKLAPGPAGVTALAAGEVAINPSLARKLHVKVGDTVVVRVEAPSAISRDAPLSGNTNDEVVLRRKVAHVLGIEDFGNFQLQASQIPPDNVFLALADVQEAVGKNARVNAAFVSSEDLLAMTMKPAERECCTPALFATNALASQLASHATLEDFGLQLAHLPSSGQSPSEWQLATERVFIDGTIAEKLLQTTPGSRGVLTYLVNGLSSEKLAARTPYSMVTAVQDFVAASSEARPLPSDSAAISAWLAEDLSLAVGDRFDIRFFTVGLGREMKEETAQFTVSSVLPMTDPRVNRAWTPDFPGVSDVDNCRDWQPGIPVKLDAIRDKDEKYWDDYRGTPKAFIDLVAGQKLWANRFGNLTAIRFPAKPDGALPAGEEEAALRKELLSRLSLADIGLVPRDFQQEGHSAAQGSVDFGGLFIGLSLFLIAAALVFSALLFLFTLEKRAAQVGLLLAVGWSPAQTRRALLGEAGLVAVLGSALGLLGGMAYTQFALAGLNGAWAGATVGLQLAYHARPETLAIAFAASLIAACGTLWLASRRMFRVPAKDLLAGEAWGSQPGFRVTKSRDLFFATCCVVGALALSFTGGRASSPEAIAGLFFGAGFLLLAAGLWLLRRLLRPSQATADAPSPTSLRQIGVRSATRRPGRSLAVIGMMACGIFLVIAVNAFRIGVTADPTRRDSGTGGFALVGESSLPLYEDLNRETTWETFALDEKLMRQVRVLPFRVREGDDASCQNLNKAQNPTLVGVNPSSLIDQNAFAFASGDWRSLGGADGEGAIPAIADQATAMWGLGKGIGDTLTYIGADGNAFTVKLVGLLAGSVLQGKLIIAEGAFLQKFPDAAGYKFFLINCAKDGGVAASSVSEHLTKQLQNRGLALEPTVARLAAFNAVQNTYIGIFTVLGGLGVLLGTLGLGVLAMRNVLERRGEFALMLALGFLPAALRRMVLSEHWMLLVAGLVLGLGSAALAVWPNLKQSGGDLPVGFLLALAVSILAFGAAVCWLAARLALRGKLLDALRRE